MQKKVVFFVVCVSVSLCSCWYYSFSGKSLPGIKTIAIPPFANQSPEVQIRDRLQSMLISTFQNENILKVVGENEADVVLRGVIEEVKDVPTAPTRKEEARQFELRIVVRIKLENKKTGKQMQNEQLSRIGFYKELQLRDDAIDQALQQLSRDIANKILSNW